MSNKRNTRNVKQEWHSDAKPSHNSEQALAMLVRFLARRAAEADYQASQNHTTIKLTQGE